MIQTDYALPMTFMCAQGLLGALDTLYYHELTYQLPAYAREARDELRLHGARDLIYGLLFLSLPRVAWTGAWAWALLGLVLAEVVITLIDFAVERRVRAPWGGLAAGELMMHAMMAIVYGAFLVTLAPHWWVWLERGGGLQPHEQATPELLVWLMTLMGVGVTCAGIRDLLLSSTSLPARWGARLALPWARQASPPQVRQGGEPKQL